MAGHFSYLRLAAPGHPPLDPGTPDLLGGEPLLAAYGLLSAAMQLRGWNVRYPVDDWRQPMAISAIPLKILIDTLGAESPVYIICHSRGGLLTRYVLGQLASSGTLGRVRRVLALGVPHTGSLSAVAYLGGYAYAMRRIAEIGLHLQVNLRHRYTPLEVSAIVRSWRSVYEMLPDPVRSWLPSADRARLYDPENWQVPGFPVVADYLASAVANWANVPDAPTDGTWVDVAGVGLGAYYSLPPEGPFTGSGELGSTIDGDNTVPVVSATAPGRPSILTPTGHEQLTQDGRLWDVFDQVLRGGSTGQIRMPGAVLENVRNVS